MIGGQHGPLHVSPGYRWLSESNAEITHYQYQYL